MKSTFTTGLAILFPFVLTLMVARFLINLLTSPIDPHSAFTQLFTLVIMIGLIFLTGFLAQSFLFQAFFEKIEKLLHQTPLFRSVYKSMQEMIHPFFDKDRSCFKKTVLVPFPHPGAYAVGFITRDDFPSAYSLAVLVPGTPSPLMGFLLMVPPHEVIPLNWTVEEAMKFIISCGVILESPLH